MRTQRVVGETILIYNDGRPVQGTPTSSFRSRPRLIIVIVLIEDTRGKQSLSVRTTLSQVPLIAGIAISGDVIARKSWLLHYKTADHRALPDDV